MLKLSPKINQHRHKFDSKSTKSCTMGLMCSQGAPKSHRDMDFCRHNGSRVTPQGFNSSPLAAKRHPKGFMLSPTCPPEAHIDTQRAPFGLRGGILGHPRLDFVIFSISCYCLGHFLYFFIVILGHDMLQTTFREWHIILELYVLFEKVDLQKTVVITT